MSQTRKDLRHYLEVEKKLYVPEDAGDRRYLWLTNNTILKIWKYQKILRKSEYWFNNRHRSPLHYLVFLMVYRHKNNVGRRLGIEMSENTFDIGLLIYHEGSVIVNGFASVGKNCRIHGAVCIGNRGIGQTDEEKTVSPTIGDNVDIGVGVSIIGDVHIADDTKIGAGAVVVKSCNELGKTLVGVPAHPIN